MKERRNGEVDWEERIEKKEEGGENDEEEESPPSLEWSHNVTCERCLLSHNDNR